MTNSSEHATKGLRILSVSGEVQAAFGVSEMPQPLPGGEDVKAYIERVEAWELERLRETCQSLNHDHADCCGEIWECGGCGAYVCEAEGGTDEGFLGEVCDTCWAAAHLGNPHLEE